MTLYLPPHLLNHRVTYRMDFTELLDCVHYELGRDFVISKEFVGSLIRYYLCQRTIHGYGYVDEYELFTHLEPYLDGTNPDDALCTILESVDNVLHNLSINPWGIYTIEVITTDIIDIEYLVDLRILQWSQEHAAEYGLGQNDRRLYFDRYSGH